MALSIKDRMVLIASDKKGAIKKSKKKMRHIALKKHLATLDEVKRMGSHFTWFPHQVVIKKPKE